MERSSARAPYGEPDVEGFYLGKVRISHRAIRTMVEQAALRTPGVVAIARAPRGVSLGRPFPWGGIGLAARNGVVSIDLYLLAERSAHLAEVGAQAQTAVAESVERLLGMRVSEVNVYIQDVV